MKLQFSACLTLHQYQSLPNPRSGNWWLAKLGKDGLPASFINIGRHPGYYPLSIEVNIPPGQYLLGCGTKQHFRQKLTVYKEAEHA